MIYSNDNEFAVVDGINRLMYHINIYQKENRPILLSLKL